MAVLVGILAGAAIQAQQSGRSTAIDAGTPPASGVSLTSPALAGQLARPGMSPEPQIQLDGVEANATHLWDKLVLVPSTKALGLVASEQTFPLELWNTYRRTQWSISSAVVSGVGGLQLSGVSLPAQLSPLGSQIFTANVPDVGPATISNSATFTVAYDRIGAVPFAYPMLTVTGLRITPFPFEPDWTDGIRERVEYKTSVYTSRNGMEQRARLRNIPRRGIEFSVLPMDRTEAQSLDSLLWARQGQVFGVPWWPDGVQFSGTISQGDTTIAIDTTNRLFSLSTMVMVWESPARCEIQTVESVSASLVTCSALSATYTNPIVLPVFVGRLEGDVDIARVTPYLSEGTVKFACEVGSSDPRPSPGALPQVYGYDVLEVEPDWQTHGQKSRRILSRFDPGYGMTYVRDRSGISFQSFPFRWFIDGRAAVQTFRDFVDRRAGALVPFWVPTGREDMTLSQQAASGSNAIVVRSAGYTARMFPDVSRRYLAIRNPNGGWLYRKVLSAGVAGEEETIGLDAQHGVLLPAGTAVSFLTLCRLQDDVAEIEWANTSFGEAQQRFVELPKEAV